MKTKALIAILFLFVVAFLAYYWVYVRSEENIAKQRISVCQFFEISHQLTSFYSNNSTYPDEAYWINSINAKFVDKQCRGELLPALNSFRDALGATYEYKKLGEHSIIISRVPQNDESSSDLFPQQMIFVKGKIK
ncbi:hypothetical protein [Glaciecola sp. MF2-115]|uniref:hypothetical protein n=1 Tax=Glaciecola sp. MF2-115 TaxID=3384827 RepID=UPI00399FD0DC